MKTLVENIIGAESSMFMLFAVWHLLWLFGTLIYASGKKSVFSIIILLFILTGLGCSIYAFYNSAVVFCRLESFASSCLLVFSLLVIIASLGGCDSDDEDFYAKREQEMKERKRREQEALDNWYAGWQDWAAEKKKDEARKAEWEREHRAELNELNRKYFT